MKIRENYDLKKINVPKQFFNTLPSEKKILDKRNNIIKNPKGIYITINSRRQLLDGFASYLAAGSLKIDRLNIRQLNIIEERSFRNTSKTTFVYGVHPNNPTNKEYVWRLTNSKEKHIGKIKKGDYLMVATKHGPAPIIVTKIKKQEYSPITNKIKTVIGRIENYKSN